MPVDQESTATVEDTTV
ncbi:hypothetical protein EYZ11_003424 [Aspergillus tanneri]|uniref:Uncharacterized protein n=1 Tax=Aspergillus tanneri TaxID=1220188 RepID=A0A4S3JN94_9EURO|nr:hypothetical protein EYZ11_003424 [Aspergillus tanneri]